MKKIYLFLIIILALFISCDGFTSNPPNYLIGTYNEIGTGKYAKKKLIIGKNKFFLKNEEIEYKGNYEFKYNKFRQEKKGVIQVGILTLTVKEKDGVSLPQNKIIKIRINTTLKIYETKGNVIKGILTLEEYRNSDLAKQFFKDNISLNSLAKISYELKELEGDII